VTWQPFRLLAYCASSPYPRRSLCPSTCSKACTRRAAPWAPLLSLQDLNAKLSDYGLAKQVGSGKDGYLVTQKVMGTVGYPGPRLLPHR